MNREIKCPHCNSIYDIDKNESYYLYETDDYEQLKCNECEQDFYVKVNFSYSFETEVRSGGFVGLLHLL